MTAAKGSWLTEHSSRIENDALSSHEIKEAQTVLVLCSNYPHQGTSDI